MRGWCARPRGTRVFDPFEISSGVASSTATGDETHSALRHIAVFVPPLSLTGRPQDLAVCILVFASAPDCADWGQSAPASPECQSEIPVLWALRIPRLVPCWILHPSSIGMKVTVLVSFPFPTLRRSSAPRGSRVARVRNLCTRCLTRLTRGRCLPHGEGRKGEKGTEGRRRANGRSACGCR